MDKWSKKEALHYLRDKTKNVKTAMLTTGHDKNGVKSRPTGTADVDNDGNIWFLTDEYSPTAKEMPVENTVSVTYSDPHNNTYLSVHGNAELIDDKKKKKELWNPFARAFFPNGLNDPKLTLIRIKPDNAEYWENNSRKVNHFFKKVKAAVSGAN